MKPTLTTRKPIVKLSNLDLRTFPIWEFALDEEGIEGQDETWVKPVAKPAVPLNSYSQIVAATFRSASFSANLSGFMVLTTKTHEIVFRGTAHNLAGVTPGAIITASDVYCYIPVEARVEAARTPLRAARIVEERNQLAKNLGVNAKELFPLDYQLLVLVELESSFRHGTID